MAVLISSGRPRRQRHLKKWLCFWVVLPALTFSGALERPAQAEISKEYQVKAVFLFNFAQFVTWPTNVFPDAQTPLTIGVLGDDPLADFLDKIVRDEKVGGHPLVIRRYQRVEDIQSCQILFVSRSKSKWMSQILGDLKDRHILTVSDIEGFVKNGGVIRFVTEANKIHFRISLEAAKNAGLTISSKLLRLAEIVEPGKD